MTRRVVAYLESRAGAQMGKLIARLGAAALHAPALAEAPAVDRDELREWLGHVAATRDLIVIFQTGVGVTALFEAFDALGTNADFRGVLARATVVARGPKPTAALRSRDIRIDIHTASPFTTTEILAALQQTPLRNREVTVQRHGGPNPALAAGLLARGAMVRELSAYRWSLPHDTAPLATLIDALVGGTVDVLIVTSASQIYNLLTFADVTGQRAACTHALAQVKVLSIGPTCSEALRDAGIAVAAEASPPKLGALMELAADFL